MSAFKVLRGVTVAVCLAASLLSVLTSGATATGTNLCVSTNPLWPTLTPFKGKCPPGYALTELGAQGSTGATGATGQTGAIGVTGATGPTGAAGATGSSGTNGVTGATGPQGTPGSPGANGETEATAEQERLVRPVHPEQTAKREQLAQTTSGSAGDTGATGATGATGELPKAEGDARYEPKSSFGGPTELSVAGGGGPQDCVLAEIRLMAGDVLPLGTLPAKGQLLSISQNTALFSVIGTIYGGNGISNFALPNLAGLGPGDTNYVICIEGIFP